MDKLQKGSKLAKGSIYDVANQQGIKTEEVLADADIVVMLDVSGSMGGYDDSATSRFDRATKSLEEIQSAFPGRVALIQFSSDTRMELSGIPNHDGGGTNMMPALQMAKQFDGLDTKFYLISDGSPTDMGGTQALVEFAKTFEDPINCIFIGGDFDTRGLEFMRDVANITNGSNSGKVDAKMLGKAILQLVAARG